MIRSLSWALFSMLMLIESIGLCATFDERQWEKYAEIEASRAGSGGSLVGVYLDPQQFGDITSNPPFGDLRLVTDQKDEVPLQIMSRKPEKRREELAHKTKNRSLTEKGATWIELVLDNPNAHFNAVEIVTPDTNFTRQVQVLGSKDAKTWNTLRGDGLIFDKSRGEKLHHTRIGFPESNFRIVAIQIENNGAQELTLSDVKVLRESVSEGQTYTIRGTIERSHVDTSRQDSSLVIRMDTVFPLDRLIISTPERNFQRSVEVQIKRPSRDWEHWTQGTIFSFDTPEVHESRFAIDLPEVAVKEFRLVFRNMDSPPLSVTAVTGEGYRRLLVFKHPANSTLYLFWSNPLARQPEYDLAALVAKYKPHEVPILSLGASRENPKYAGDNARLPFTERYKYLLYVVVAVAIASLIFLQYRAFKRGTL